MKRITIWITYLPRLTDFLPMAIEDAEVTKDPEAMEQSVLADAKGTCMVFG